MFIIIQLYHILEPSWSCLAKQVLVFLGFKGANFGKKVLNPSGFFLRECLLYMFLWNFPVNNCIMPLRVIHLTALANEMISCCIFISTQSAEGRHILFFNGSLDYIRRQCLILCGSYKPFGLFLQIPLLQPIPWPLSLDLFCLTQCLAVKGLVFQFLIFSKVSSFSSSLCGLPHFLSYLFKFYCFLQWSRDVLNAIGQLLFIENTLLQAIQYTAPGKSSRVGSVNIRSWMKHTLICCCCCCCCFFLFLSMASSSALL